MWRKGFKKMPIPFTEFSGELHRTINIHRTPMIEAMAARLIRSGFRFEIVNRDVDACLLAAVVHGDDEPFRASESPKTKTALMHAVDGLIRSVYNDIRT